MPGWFITAIIFGVLALIALIGSRFTPPVSDGDDPARFIATALAVALALVAALCLVLSSFDIVSTRNVGIVTQFGKPVGTRGNGLAWHAPWQKISELSEAIQLQSFQGTSYDDPQSAIKVRLGNNSAAYVEENLNWRLRQGAAAQLFQDYRDFDNIKINLVDKQAQVALAKEFSTFNPQTMVAAVDPNQPTTIPTQAQGADLPGMAARVKTDLQNAVGHDIEILDVRIPGIFYDSATQNRIDAFNQKVQETKNAQQDVQTATQSRLASEQRAQQAPPDLKVAIFNCINTLVEKGQDPAGCWGQIGSGGNSLINIPVK